MIKLDQRLGQCITYALYFGLFVLVAGFFASPGSSTHHTQVYIGFYVPAVAALLWYSPALAQDLRRDRTLQCFTALMAWLAISISWTTHVDTAHLYKLVAMTWILVLAVRVLMDDMKRFNLTMGLGLGVAAVVILVTLIIYLHTHGTDFYLSRLAKLGERAVPEVVIGKICAVYMMYCLMQERLTDKIAQRVAFTSMGLLFLLPVMLSFSRTAFLALLLISLWYFLQNRKTRASVIIAGITALIFIIMLMDNQNQWLTNISRSETFEIRLWGWKATWQEILNHPWFGQGLEAPFVVDWRGTPYTVTGIDFHHAHNLLLAIWYDAGIVGLGLLLALLGLTLQKFRTLLYINEVRYWSYIFLFVLIVSMVDDPTLIDRPGGDWLWFWLPLAIAINIDKFSAATPHAGKSADT